MTTRASTTPIRHPWFDPPSTKRKLSVSTTTTPPSPKRRKFSVLESGFAQLTLNNSLDITPDAPGHPSTSPGWPCISELVQPPCELLSATDNTNVKALAHDVILPSYVEEPSVPDVKMKTSSWYEPEPDRIVVTDLDSFAYDDDDESAELDTSSISISHPLLERLASHAKKLIDPPPSSSQALVLYRPLQHGPSTDDSKSNEGIIGTTVSEVTGEDNSMEVDP